MFYFLCFLAQAQASDFIILDVGKLNYKDLVTSTDIKSDDLELDNTITTEQSLQQQNQIVVNKNAGIGRYSTVFLQGSQSSHILNLKNNFRSSDPSLPSRVYNYGDSLHGLTDSIKVIQGPDSIEYGSDALAGVIQMNQSFNPNSHYEADVLVGSYETHQFQLIKQGPYLEWSITALESKGISEVEAPLNEADSIKAQKIEASYLLNTTDTFRFSINNIKTDLDDYTTKPVDDPNYYTEDQSYSLNWQRQEKYDNFNSSMGLSFEAFNRHVINEEDETSLKTLDEVYSAQSHQAYIKFKEVFNVFDFGFDFYNEVAELPNLENKKVQQHFGAWGRSQFEITKTQMLNFGIRHYNIKNSKGFVHQLEYVYDLSSFTLWSRWSSGFKAASISDLYSPVVGNKDLNDEKNNFYELGIKYGDRYNYIKFLYFKNKYKDLIQYKINDGLLNIGRAQIEGYELSSSHWFKGFSVKPFVNYWSSKNLVTQKQLTLRPKWVVGLGLKKQFFKYDFQLLSKYIGQRFDYAGNPLEGYIRYDFFLKYRINKKIKIYFNILNAFDAKARWALGYSSQPRELYMGINYIF